MKKTFTLLCFVLLATTGYSQAIKYHDVNPDTTIAHWEVFSALGADIWWHPSPEVVVKTWGETQVLCDNDTMALALNQGDSISANSTGKWLKLAYKCLNCGGVLGNWKGATDKYLAVRDTDANGNWQYGWVRLTIPANATSFTIKDYAMHKTANTKINAGQSVATSVSGHVYNTGHLKLYAHGKQVYASGFTGRADIAVMDISGKLLLRKTIDKNEALDMSAYGSGIYLFHVSDGTNSKSAKLSIE